MLARAIVTFFIAAWVAVAAPLRLSPPDLPQTGHCFEISRLNGSRISSILEGSNHQRDVPLGRALPQLSSFRRIVCEPKNLVGMEACRWNIGFSSMAGISSSFFRSRLEALHFYQYFSKPAYDFSFLKTLLGIPLGFSTNPSPLLHSKSSPPKPGSAQQFLDEWTEQGIFLDATLW